jgi:hypothetical protein
MTRLSQICLLLTAIVAIESLSFESWAQLPGAAVDVSAKGNELWVINSAQQIFRWKDGAWVHMPGAAVKVGASPDGWSWVVNSADDIFRWNVNNNQWDHIPGKLVQVSAISKDRALGVNRAGGIFLWENNAWKQLPGGASWAAIGDGDERWVVNSAGNIYRWNHEANTWTHIPGGASNVDTQNADRVIVTNSAGNMYAWNNGVWQLLPGGCTRATITNDYAYCVNSAYAIWKLKIGPNEAAPITPAQSVGNEGYNFQGWTQMPGGAWDVSAKGNELWVTNPSHQIYRWKNDAWVHMPGAAVRVGASPDGWSWVVNGADDIFRWNVNNNQWDHIPGKLVQVSASSKDRALGVNRAGGIFLWENNTWKQLPGGASWAAIGDGDERWVVNSAGNIYRWNHGANTWNHIPGGASNVDTQNANRVIVTNSAGNMYIWRDGTWQLLPGGCIRAPITNDHAYCVNAAHNIFKGRFGPNNATSTSTGTQNVEKVVEKEVVFVKEGEGSETQVTEETGDTRIIWKEVVVYE